VKNPTLAVIGFPGNNCEIETVRAAERNGFKAQWIRWNQVDLVGGFDAYVLPGGFSFEDRGRAGAIAAREPIFDALRKEAQTGKVILGICNGAQMIVESGLIPVGDNPLPFSLADNIRRDELDHVVGTGYYTTWVDLNVDRADTAFTNKVTDPVRVPIAHGEGRFTSVDVKAQEALAGSDQVAFRYTKNPNGAEKNVAMIVNIEGNVGALMPHPERFFEEFSGDQIWQSMKVWIENNQSPEIIKIGDLTQQELPEIYALEIADDVLCAEKRLIITDNEAFSVQSAARVITGSDITLDKSLVYLISGQDLTTQELSETGLIHNPNKENLVEFATKSNQILVEPFVNDEADHLAEQLTEVCGKTVSVRILKGWESSGDMTEILKNGLLANPNAQKIFK